MTLNYVDVKFPSPIGELHFSIWIIILNLKTGLVSVPYRGTTFLNLRRLRSDTNWSKVSVPYRGATFLNRPQYTVRKLRNLFPSPIGELHFSMHKVMSYPRTDGNCFRPLSGSYISQWGTSPAQRAAIIKFPSPIGELHFSIISFFSFHFSVMWVFPSPIGELHFSIDANAYFTPFSISFRPLSGSYISQWQ